MADGDGVNGDGCYGSGDDDDDINGDDNALYTGLTLIYFQLTISGLAK